MQGENGILIRTMEQVVYPISDMMLTASSLGISSCIIGAMWNEITQILPEVSNKTKENLGLKKGEIISTIIALGYDANPTETTKQRKDFDEIIFLGTTEQFKDIYKGIYWEYGIPCKNVRCTNGSVSIKVQY